MSYQKSMAPLTRLQVLAEAQLLERAWDNAGGPAHSPKRDALAARIKVLRDKYDTLTNQLLPEVNQHDHRKSNESS